MHFEADAWNRKKDWEGTWDSQRVSKRVEQLCWCALLTHARYGNRITYSTVHMYTISNGSNTLEHASGISERVRWLWNQENVLKECRALLGKRSHAHAGDHQPVSLLSTSVGSSAQLIRIFYQKVIQLIPAFKILWFFFIPHIVK